jgi:hypothetical protein
VEAARQPDFELLHSGWDRLAARKLLPFADAAVTAASSLRESNKHALVPGASNGEGALDHTGATFERKYWIWCRRTKART